MLKTIINCLTLIQQMLVLEEQKEYLYFNTKKGADIGNEKQKEGEVLIRISIS